MLLSIMKLLVVCLMLLLRTIDAENLVFGRPLSDDDEVDAVCITRHWFSLKPQTVEQRFPRRYGYYQHPINFIDIRDNINNWAGRYPYIRRGGVSEKYVQLSFYAPIMRGIDYDVRIYTSAALKSFLQSPLPYPKSPTSAAPRTNAPTRVYNTTVSTTHRKTKLTITPAPAKDSFVNTTRTKETMLVNASTLGTISSYKSEYNRTIGTAMATLLTETSAPVGEKEAITAHTTPNATNLLESTRAKHNTTALTTSTQIITPAPARDSFVNTTVTEVTSGANSSGAGTEANSYASGSKKTVDTATTTLWRETSVTMGETAPTNPSATDTSKGTRDETMSTTAIVGAEKSNTIKPQNNTGTDISGDYIPQTTPMPDTKNNDSTSSLQTNLSTLSPKLFTETSTTVSEGSSTESSDDTTFVSLIDLSTPDPL